MKRTEEKHGKYVWYPISQAKILGNLYLHATSLIVGVVTYNPLLRHVINVDDHCDSTRNAALEKVTPLKYGHFWYLRFNDFAHIPWEDTPNFPKTPQRKDILHKLLVKHPGAHLPGGLPGGPVGGILECWISGGVSPHLPLLNALRWASELGWKLSRGHWNEMHVVREGTPGSDQSAGVVTPNGWV